MFVNIKVDREERPDIDQIYQAAHALLTRRIVILSGPDDALGTFQAVLAGTYLPTTISLAIANGTVSLPSALARPVTAKVNAYVCQDVTCLAPLKDIARLKDALKITIVSV